MFNLPPFQVSDVVVDDKGGRTVTIGTGVTEARFPTCTQYIPSTSASSARRWRRDPGRGPLHSP